MVRLDYTPDDGYTEPGFIKAVPGVHGDFRFRFRPMLIEQQSALGEAGGKMKADAYDRKLAAEVAQHVTEWSLNDANGNTVDVTPKAVLRLKPMLYSRLWAIVLGTAATDIDPEWSDEAKQDEAEAEHESALSGQDVSGTKALRDEKNSGAG